MSDEIIKRDSNFRTIGAGIANDSSQDVLMLRVDPVTNYLLVNITNVGATAGTANQIAKRDENHKTVCMGWDDTNQCLQEILTDNEGRLLCDLIFT